MFFEYNLTAEERKELAKDIAGTHAAYGSGWGGLAIVDDDDEDDEVDCDEY